MTGLRFFDQDVQCTPEVDDMSLLPDWKWRDRRRPTNPFDLGAWLIWFLAWLQGDFE